MKTNEIYVGTRKDEYVVQELLDRGIAKLNQGLANNLRSTCMKKGIKKTEQGKRLEFLVVSTDEYKKFRKELEALVVVDSDALSTKLKELNSKPEYQGGMESSVYAKYNSELESAFTEVIEVVGKDENKRTKAKKVVVKNPFKVGDWVDTTDQYSYNAKGKALAMKKLNKELSSVTEGNVLLSDAARIYKVSDSSYWIEVPVLKEAPKGVSNWKWAADRFDNLVIVKGCDSEYQHDHDWYIPYEGNEDKIEFIKSKTPVRVSERDIEWYKYDITDCKGYRSEYTQRD